MSLNLLATISHERACKMFQILEIKGPDYIVSRLFELGFLTGKFIKLVRAIPFGGVHIIEIDDNLVALRREEIKCLCIRPIIIIPKKHQ